MSYSRCLVLVKGLYKIGGYCIFSNLYINGFNLHSNIFHMVHHALYKIVCVCVCVCVYHLVFRNTICKEFWSFYLSLLIELVWKKNMWLKQVFSICLTTEKILLDPQPRAHRVWMIYSIVSGSSGSSLRGSAVNEPDWEPWGCGFYPWPYSVG